MTTIARFEFKDDEGIHKNDIQWDYATGGFAMCDGIEAYAQTLAAVILTVQGELITRKNYGIPYFSTIFTSKVYADEWAQDVVATVSNLDFIESIDKFEYEYDKNRKVMKYQLEVTTTDGSSVQLDETV